MVGDAEVWRAYKLQILFQLPHCSMGFAFLHTVATILDYSSVVAGGKNSHRVPGSS